LNAEKVAEKCEQWELSCFQKEKDLYLYYFLAQKPGIRLCLNPRMTHSCSCCFYLAGKTIVFVNAISCLRRVLAILTILRVSVFALHAQMQQRQRLKSLDRFKVWI